MPSRRRHHQDGFTLIELLVGMTLSLIVLFAILQSLDRFSSSTVHQTRVLDANDQIRTLMERTVRELRGAGVITSAGPTDLIYTVREPAATRTERLCMAGGNLYGFTSRTPATPPTSGTACTLGKRLATLGSTSKTAFSYDGATSSATPALVKNVGLTLSLDSTNGSRVSQSTLRASATRRSGALLVTPEDVDTTCLSDGALLSLDAGLPGVNLLSVKYTNDSGVAIGVLTAQGVKIPLGITSVIATITDAAGVSSTVRRSLECG
jgi:prepilin-type N-terminal cleavage/methylation domain-containing protein